MFLHLLFAMLSVRNLSYNSLFKDAILQNRNWFHDCAAMSQVCRHLLDRIYIRLVTSAPLMMRMRLNRMAAISMTITPASMVSPATSAILSICSAHPPQACRQPDPSCKICVSVPAALSLTGMHLLSADQRKHLHYCQC